jgi:photosystem II stability/assembly factor-like uncharacterized protein
MKDRQLRVSRAMFTASWMIFVICAVPLVFTWSLAGCGVSKNAGEAVDQIDWRDVPQFKSFSVAGIGTTRSLWILTSKGELFRTINFGEPLKVQLDAAVGKPEVIFFLDEEHGWLINHDNIAWRTINSGQSWEKLATSQSSGERFYLPQQLIFVNESRGWLVDNFAIWRTDDGGRSWKHLFSTRESPPNKAWKPLRASFIDNVTGWVSCTDNTVLRTRNGGDTWENLTVDPSSTDLKDVQFIDMKTGWIAEPPQGAIYRTDNAGDTWLREFSGHDEEIHINSVYFPDADSGWAVGFQSHGGLRDLSRGLVLHTSDAGKSWQIRKVGESDLFFDRVYFADKQSGWLFGRDNVYQTRNGGEAWERVLSLPPLIKASG